MAAAFAGLFRRGELYPRAIRFSTIVIALFFCGVCAWAVFSGDIQSRSSSLYMQICFAFLALLDGDGVRAVEGARSAEDRRGDVRAAGRAARAGVVASWRVGDGGGRPRCDGRCRRRRRRWWVRARSRCSWRECWRRCCFRRARFVNGAGRSRWWWPLLLTAGLRLRAGMAVRPHPGERPLRSAARATARRLSRGRRAHAGVPRLDVRDHRAHLRQGWNAPRGYGLVLLALGGYDQASPVELCFRCWGWWRSPSASCALYLTPTRACRASACPSGGHSSGGSPRASATAPGPTETRPEAVVVAEGELEVSRIQTHRRGQPVDNQVDAQARHARRAGCELRQRGPRRRRREHRAAPALARAQPREQGEAAAREDRRPGRSIRSSACTAPRRWRTPSCADGWSGSKATVCSRSGAAAPRATSCRTPARTRPRR